MSDDAVLDVGHVSGPTICHWYVFQVLLSQPMYVQSNPRDNNIDLGINILSIDASAPSIYSRYTLGPLAVLVFIAIVAIATKFDSCLE